MREKRKVSRVTPVSPIKDNRRHGSTGSYHIFDYPKSMRVLCVNDKITFRIATLTYRCLNGSAPSYLSRLIIPLKNSRSLR